ncbi:MAG: peptidylprolyl isomerase [Acidobacteria bacterium]|nr:peptidylprolyl isomerase [Acidobacteriota bacterium]
MSQVREGDTITLHYTGKLDDGTVFDSSVGRQPLRFTVGANEVIPGFEAGAVGMSVGEKRDIVITPDQAYGPYFEELVKIVARENFPPEVTPAVGLMFEMQLPSGEAIPVRIIEVEGEDVTLDANHLLAGETLFFNLELVSIDKTASSIILP